MSKQENRGLGDDEFPPFASSPAHQQCRACGRSLPLSGFTKDKSKKNGHGTLCRACRSAYDAGHYAKHAAERRAKQALYDAKHAERRKQYDAGRIAESRARHAEYYVANRELFLARQSAYSKTEAGRASQAAARHNRRIRLNGHILTKQIISEVKEASNNICPYCGSPFTDGHIDHIVPVSRGGTNARDNLLYVCADCNHRKGNRLLADFLSMLNLKEDEQWLIAQ